MADSIFSKYLERGALAHGFAPERCEIFPGRVPRHFSRQGRGIFLFRGERRAPMDSELPGGEGAAAPFSRGLKSCLHVENGFIGVLVYHGLLHTLVGVDEPHRLTTRSALMKIHAGWIALGLTSLFAVGCGGGIGEETAGTNREAMSEDELGLLVTPDELAALGASEEEISAQAKLFEQLTAEEVAAQAALRKSQEEVAHELKRLPDISIKAASSETSRGGVSPMIYNAVCWPNNDYYTVYWSGDRVACFADAGTISASYVNTSGVRPGNNVGRVYYSSGSKSYWSPWRGKSMNTYFFKSPVKVRKVQIK